MQKFNQKKHQHRLLAFFFDFKILSQKRQTKNSISFGGYMKKFFSFLLIFAMLFSTCIFISGCKSDGDKKVIKINQVTNSLFYAPFYVAINNGYFEDEGYTIDLTTAEGSNTTNVALMTNSADIGLMGPEQNIYSYVGGDDNYPIAFAQLTKRDGSFLISRKAEPDFDWSNLAGKHIIAGRKGGSPAMSLQLALEKNGYDISKDLTFDTSISFANIAGSFLSGVGDYMTLFEPSASEFQKSGKGYIVASVGAESGEIPFTCFSANKSFIQQNPQVIIAFLKALNRGLNFVKTAKIDDVVKAIQPSFSASTADSIKTAVQNYIDSDAWDDDLIMSSEAFDRLILMLQTAGELEKTTTVGFESIVDNNFATLVKAEFRL